MNGRDQPLQMGDLVVVIDPDLSERASRVVVEVCRARDDEGRASPCQMLVEPDEIVGHEPLLVAHGLHGGRLGQTPRQLQSADADRTEQSALCHC